MSRDDQLNSLINIVKASTSAVGEISLDQELYYDLKISGDDLHDMLVRISGEFGTDFSALDLRRYAPGEGFAIVKPALALAGAQPYDSLTVGDVWNAVQEGRWNSGNQRHLAKRLPRSRSGLNL